MLRPFCWEHFRMRSSVPSSISTIAVPPCGIDARVSANNRHGLFSLLGGDGQDDVKNQRRQHGAVPSLRSGQALAAAEAHQPGALVLQIEVTERTLNVLKNSHGHLGEYLPQGV